MAILSGQFTKALESIEPSADDKANAPKAHQASDQHGVEAPVLECVGGRKRIPETAVRRSGARHGDAADRGLHRSQRRHRRRPLA